MAASTLPSRAASTVGASGGGSGASIAASSVEPSLDPGTEGPQAAKATAAANQTVHRLARLMSTTPGGATPATYQGAGVASKLTSLTGGDDRNASERWRRCHDDDGDAVLRPGRATGVSPA